MSRLEKLKQQLDQVTYLYNQEKKAVEQNKVDEELKKYNPVIEQSIYGASDYAGFSAGDYAFYYGYERLAPHPLFKDCSDGDDTTWAFVVEKNNKEIFRKAIYPEHINWNCYKGLIAGIIFWMQSQTQQEK